LFARRQAHSGPRGWQLKLLPQHSWRQLPSEQSLQCELTPLLAHYFVPHQDGEFPHSTWRSMLRPVARRIAAGVIAAFTSAISRRMGWGPLPWQRNGNLGESKANSKSGGKASLGEMLLAKLRFWKRESSSIPSGWSVVVDKDNSVLQEWFFLLYHARTRTRIEVTGPTLSAMIPSRKCCCTARQARKNPLYEKRRA